MASLDDVLARLAPRSVGPLSVQWDMDHAPGWLEIAGWFSPGLKLGFPKHEVRFVHRLPRTGDVEGDVRKALDHVVTQVRTIMEPAKRKPGRPKKVAA